MRGSSSPIQILAVDDHPLVRQGIAGLVGVQLDMTLVAEAANGRDAIQRFRETRNLSSPIRRLVDHRPGTEKSPVQTRAAQPLEVDW